MRKLILILSAVFVFVLNAAAQDLTTYGTVLGFSIQYKYKYR